MKNLFIFLALAIAVALPAHAQTVPRTLIAFYDSREESSPRTTLIHRFLEMPANHLGYVLRYRDINAPLPELDEGVRGIVLWFNGGSEVPEPSAFFDWLNDAGRRGKKILILENAGLGDRHRGDAGLMEKANRVFARIGFRDTNRWQSLTYQVHVLKRDAEMTGFERPYEAALPAYMDTRVVGKNAVSALKVALELPHERTVSDLVVTGSGGGYVAPGYALYHVVEQGESKIHQWYVNPFLFLERALEGGEESPPRPDTTTLMGNRLFYAQADGDGWNNLSEIPEFQKKLFTNAEVLRDEIFARFPNLAFTVGVIGSDLDPACYGLKRSAEVARAILGLPNTEAASHSFSHPLYWRFFAQYSKEKEQPYLRRYPPRPVERSSLWSALFSTVLGHKNWRAPSGASEPHLLPPPGKYDMSEEEALTRYYETPRSYACAPFDFAQELAAGDWLPPEKKLRLFTWSGDTVPFAAAQRAVREAGLLNLGGGAAGFDPDYPSAAFIPPVGLESEGERQIYSANGNESDDLQPREGRFSGARFVQEMARVTEYPRRLRPLSLYFHFYAAQTPAALAALRESLEWAEKREIIPVTAADYAETAQGFYSLRLQRLGEQRWQVENRGALQTLRFDHAALKSVDFDRSNGVLGQRWLKGSLYVALDPAVQTSRIALMPNTPGAWPSFNTAYLLSSRWVIKSLQTGSNSLTFIASGYGPGMMRWRMPAQGSYQVTVSRGAAVIGESKAQTDEMGVLDLALSPLLSTEPVMFTLRKME